MKDFIIYVLFGWMPSHMVFALLLAVIAPYAASVSAIFFSGTAGVLDRIRPMTIWLVFWVLVLLASNAWKYSPPMQTIWGIVIFLLAFAVQFTRVYRQLKIN